MRILVTFCLIAAVLIASGCNVTTRSIASQGTHMPQIFNQGIPTSEGALKELASIRETFPGLDAEILAAQQELGVPQGLLRCLLLKPAGLGQLNSGALQELNLDPSYVVSVPSVAGATPLPPPLVLDVTRKHWMSLLNGSALTSETYKRSDVSVYASAAYLNNRYVLLKEMLEASGTRYDPTLLWFYAAAAYQVGTQAIFTLLTHESLSRGDQALRFMLENFDAAFNVLAKPEHLLYPLRPVWVPRLLDQQVSRLAGKMKQIQDCVGAGSGVSK